MVRRIGWKAAFRTGVETAEKHGARREIGAGLAPVRPDQCLKHRTKRKGNTRTILSCLGVGRVFLSVPKNSESIRKRLINLTILKTRAPSPCKSCEREKKPQEGKGLQLPYGADFSI